MIRWTLLTLVLLFALVMLVGYLGDPDGAKAKARREAQCTAALDSARGTSLRSYNDRMAYEARVRDACR
jgi:hypothetical protein